MIEAAVKERLGLEEDAGNLIRISSDFLKSIKDYHYKQCKYPMTASGRQGLNFTALGREERPRVQE